MDARLALLVLFLGLVSWGFFKQQVILIFAVFLFPVVSILLERAGLDLSTRLMRISMFGFYILLGVYHGNSLKRLFSRAMRNGFLLGYLALFLMAIISTMYSYSNVDEKLALLSDMLIYVVVPTTLFVMLFYHESDYKDFPIQFSILALVSFVIVMLYGDTSLVVMSDRTTLQKIGLNSIYLSRIGVISLLSSITLFYYDKRLILRAICILAAVTSVFIILISSQRASIIGLAVALMFWFQFGIRIQGSLKPILIVLMLVAILAHMNIEQFSVVDRFKDLENYETYARYGDYSTSLSLFLKKPIFGHGLMGYFEITGRPYPHNVFLELMVEYGIVGFLVYLLMMREVIFVIRRAFNEPEANFGMQAISLSWISLFVAMLFSGTLSGNHDFFALSGMLSALKHNYLSPIRQQYVIRGSSSRATNIV